MIDLVGIYSFVATFVDLKRVPAGEQCSNLTNSEEELLEIHKEYTNVEPEFVTSETEDEWWEKRRSVWRKYAPRYQAWSDRHKLGYQFIWDTQD